MIFLRDSSCVIQTILSNLEEYLTLRYANLLLMDFKGIFIKIFPTFLKVVVLDYKSIICPGKTFVMHLQAIIEEVTIKALICLVGTRATIVTVSKIFIELYS